MSKPVPIEPGPAEGSPAPRELERALWQLWQQGQRPDVHLFLAGAGDLSLADLVAVLAVDQRERWHNGERIAAEVYLQRYPALRNDVEKALELVYGEFLLREELGETPALDDYVQRFPLYAERLRQQGDLHRALVWSQLDPAEDAVGRQETMRPPAGGRGTLDHAESTHAAATPARQQANADSSVSWTDAARRSTPLPEVFGRYRIQQQIGQGGMGTVYLAHDTQLDRAVALKVPHFNGETNRHTLERFYREAQIAATFHHPNLCPVFDVGQIDGVHYLTMPYLQGESLSAWLRREGRLAPAVAVGLAVRVARALEVAHAAGVLHRDLKPANIMVLPNQEPVLMDFGLARREATGDRQLTSSGFVLGTPAYISPEQIGGSPGSLGPACDIYCLGAVLYEMLAGRTPFVGTVHEVLRQKLTTPPPALSAVVPGIDPRLEALCLAAQAPEPAQRFASAAAFAEELERWLREVPASAAPSDTFRLGGVVSHFPVDSTCVVDTPWPRKHATRRWWRPRVLGITALGVAVLALVIGLLTLPHFRDSAIDPLPTNSRWEGRFTFRRPNEGTTGSVSLEITERQGEAFVGTYATEEDRWQWEVKGSLHESNIHWELTRLIRAPDPRQVLGRAKVTGQLHGARMEVLYQDEDSVADMTLRRK